MLIGPVLMMCPLVRANYGWMCHGGGCAAAISRAGRWREAFTDRGCPRQLTSAQQATHRVFARAGQCWARWPPPPFFLSPPCADSFKSMKMLHNLRVSGWIPDECRDALGNLLALCGKANRLQEKCEPWAPISHLKKSRYGCFHLKAK